RVLFRSAVGEEVPSCRRGSPVLPAWEARAARVGGTGASLGGSWASAAAGCAFVAATLSGAEVSASVTVGIWPVNRVASGGSPVRSTGIRNLRRFEDLSQRV